MYARQAIVTKYLGPTNTRGGRVKATAQAGSVTTEWDHALGVMDNHVNAVHQFAARMGWEGWWVAGALPDGSYVFVARDLECTVNLGAK